MTCPICHGRGRVTYDEHPEPKPRQSGSVFPCPSCEEDHLRRLAYARSQRIKNAVVIFDTTPGQAQSLVEQFRERHPQIVAFWKGQQT